MRVTAPRSSAPGELAIGVDVGGSTIKAGVVAGDGVIWESAGAPTPRTADDTYRAIADLVCDLRSRHGITRIGLAIAGFVSADRRTVRYAPHLAWRDEPVPAVLADRLAAEVVIDHDVNCAAWAEYRLGAAAGAHTPLILALGTGIGAGLIHRGRLYRGAFGTAPELGHVAVVPDGRPCPCGKRGCWERYCSGTALVTTAAEIAAARGEPTPGQGPGGPMTGATVAAAARDGDPVAIAAVRELGTWLGRGLAMAADVLDPDLIVLAGGVSASADLFLDAARAAFSAHLTGAAHRPVPTMTVARFGPQASLIGAALLAMGQGR